jgi:hypothetical protein
MLVLLNIHKCNPKLLERGAGQYLIIKMKNNGSQAVSFCRDILSKRYARVGLNDRCESCERKRIQWAQTQISHE